MSHDLLFHIVSALFSAFASAGAVYIGLDRRITRMEAKMDLILEGKVQL